MNADPLHDHLDFLLAGELPPPNIIESAIALENWFKMQGVTDWALMGVCSRNCHTERQQLREALTEIASKSGTTGIENGIPVEWDGQWAAHRAKEAL